MRAAVVVLVLAGCAAKDLDELQIACTADSECPDDTWCDIPSDYCRSLELSSPPKIVLEGAGGAPPATAISVPSNKWTYVPLRLRNTGGAQARTKIELVGPNCIHAGTSFNSDIGTLDAGELFEDDIYFDPDPGCASPARVAMEVIASGRPFTFGLDVTITP